MERQCHAEPSDRGQDRDNDPKDQTQRRPGPDGRFFTTVNDMTVKFSDATPKGERILDKAEFRPVSEYVLIQLMRRGSRSIGLGEAVDLTAPGTEAFRAFKSDRIFRFTLNDHGYEWGLEQMPESELRQVGRVHDDEVIVLVRDGEDLVIKPGDVLQFGPAGTESLYTERRLVTVYFENEPNELPRGAYTTEELKSRFDVKEGYILEVINEEGNLTPLKPGKKTRIKDGMQFFEQVPCGGSS